MEDDSGAAFASHADSPHSLPSTASCCCPCASCASCSNDAAPPPPSPPFSWTAVLYAAAYGGAFAVGALAPSVLFFSASSPLSSLLRSPLAEAAPALSPLSPLASLADAPATVPPLGAASAPTLAPFSHFLRLLSASSLKSVALYPSAASELVLIYSPQAPAARSRFSHFLSFFRSEPFSAAPALSSSIPSAAAPPLFVTRALPGSEAELSRLLMNNRGLESLQVLEASALPSLDFGADAACSSCASVWSNVVDEVLESLLALAALTAAAVVLYQIGRYFKLLPPRTFGEKLVQEPPAFARVTFADVAGHAAAKKQLKQVVQFLRDAEAFSALGARPPRGILLEGPSGTGKTMLARALAGESSVPFLSVSGSSFVEVYVGQGAARVRELFEAAKAKAPCVVFIDEFDAIALDRRECIGSSSQEYVQTVNELLHQLDGMERPSGGGVCVRKNRRKIEQKSGKSASPPSDQDAGASAAPHEKDAEKPHSSFLFTLIKAASSLPPLAFLLGAFSPPLASRSHAEEGLPTASEAGKHAGGRATEPPVPCPAPIIILAATNRVAALDEAVTRPGRFDQVIRVGLPSLAERLEALQLHSASLPLAASVDLRALAGATESFSGAELAGFCNEAALRAAREQQQEVRHEDFLYVLADFRRRREARETRAGGRPTHRGDSEDEARGGDLQGTREARALRSFVRSWTAALSDAAVQSDGRAASEDEPMAL